MTRRTFGALIAGGHRILPGQALMADPWTQVPEILRRIRPAAFPRRDFDVTRHGARGDGKADSTDAFARAVSACAAAGGGRVVVPAGDYLTGAVHLKSNVNLHLTAGATLRFFQDPARYLPVVYTRWEGVECMNYSALVYAFGQENVAVTGAGVLDGQADCTHWWPWKGRTECGWKRGDPQQTAARARLMQMGEQDVPVERRVFGEGSFLRPDVIQFYRCANVLVEGITIRNSPMYEIHPVLCRNVAVRGVKVSSHGPNNDGCDPESCRDVLIENCEFDTGDDCIAIKSGRNRDGRRVAAPCENILVRGCTMKDGHGGVTIGSEVSGDVRYVFAENCRMDSPNLERALRLKTNSVRGGVIEHVYMRDVRAGRVSGAAIDVDFTYEEGDAGKFKPVVRDIEVRNLTCASSKAALNLIGYPDAPIRDVRLIDCAFESVSGRDVAKHVEGLALRGVTINGRAVPSDYPAPLASRGKEEAAA